MSMNQLLLDKAKKIVISERNFSISFLQRRLGIGYTPTIIVMDIIKKDINRKELGHRRLISKKHKKIRYL